MLNVGDTFKSYEDLISKIKEFEEQSFIYFYKRNSMTITQARKQNIRKAFGCKNNVFYYKIDFACAKGGKNFRSSSTGARSHHTFQEGCPARIKININDSHQLSVSEFQDKHNHPLDEKNYKYMARSRRLNEEEKEEMIRLLKMNAKSKDAQNYIMSKTDKVVTLKDIRNIKFSSKSQLNAITKAKSKNDLVKIEKAKIQNYPEFDNEHCDSFSEEFDDSGSPVPSISSMKTPGKYSEATELCNQLAGEISECDTEEFEIRMQAVRSLINSYKRNMDVIICEQAKFIKNQIRVDIS